jgi:hypothetical protein
MYADSVDTTHGAAMSCLYLVLTSIAASRCNKDLRP